MTEFTKSICGVDIVFRTEYSWGLKTWTVFAPATTPSGRTILFGRCCIGLDAAEALKKGKVLAKLELEARRNAAS